MYFAICDDDPKALQQIAAVFDEYAQTSRRSVRYQLFSHADEMLRAALTEAFTHYILDIMMPGMDGLNAAEELRRIDSEAILIFLTSTPEFAYQSYHVHAADYILKPVSAAALLPVLTRMQEQEDASGEHILIQNGRSLMRIAANQLSHLEVNRKKLYFHLSNEQVYQIAGTMAEFEHRLLCLPGFIKIHRSYIVNLEHISILSPDGCIMFSGDNLPVSRLLYNQVRKQYMAYLFGETEVRP